jgi:hypothetical protein
MRPPAPIGSSLHRLTGALLCLAGALSQSAVPLLHGWQVAGEESALHCAAGRDGGGPRMSARGRGDHAGHRHHDPETCSVENALLGGGVLLSVGGSSAVFSTGPLSFPVSFSNVVRTATPDLSGGSPRGPPSA